LNPRCPEAQRFSRPSDSAALASLLSWLDLTSSTRPALTCGPSLVASVTPTLRFYARAFQAQDRQAAVVLGAPLPVWRSPAAAFPGSASAGAAVGGGCCCEPLAEGVDGCVFLPLERPCMLICMHSTSVRIDADTHEELKRLAEDLGTTVGHTVTLAVRALRQDRSAVQLAEPLRDDEAAWLNADLG